MLISSERVLQSKHALWFTFADLCKPFEVAYWEDDSPLSYR